MSDESPPTKPPSLFQDMATLLEPLPREQLMEITHQAAIQGLHSIWRRELGGRNVADAVATLFPQFPPARVAAVTRQIGLTAIRNACLKTISNVRAPWLFVIRCPDREAIRALRAIAGPAILAYWHFGPVNLISLGLRRIGVPALVITRSTLSRWISSPELQKMRLVLNEADPQQSVIALRRSLKHLRAGGKVATALDGSVGKRDVSVPFLGHQLAISRGAAGLARLTGAPIIPCTMEWEPSGWNVSIRVFDRLPQPKASPEEAEAFEQETMEIAARRFEEYGRQRPGQFKIDQLAEILDSPKVGA